MANYYTEFSTFIPMPGVTEEALEKWLEDHRNDETRESDWFGCDASYDDGGLWVRSREGDVVEASELIQKALDYFEIEGSVVFEYSFTCSKLRPGGFGGGVAVITRKESHWSSVSEIVEAFRTRFDLPPVIN